MAYRFSMILLAWLLSVPAYAQQYTPPNSAQVKAIVTQNAQNKAATVTPQQVQQAAINQYNAKQQAAQNRQASVPTQPTLIAKPPVPVRPAPPAKPVPPTTVTLPRPQIPRTAR